MEEPIAVRRKLRGDEVLAMVEAGILDEDEPVELLDGELVVVSPQGPPHASTAAEVAARLRSAYGDGFHARLHSPVVAGPHSLPEPDVAVVRGTALDYRHRHPVAADTALVVEVSSSSRRTDRRKAAIYAAAGYAAYWIVDVVAGRLEVRTGPGPDRAYGVETLLGPDDSVTPPGARAAVALDFLRG